MTDIDEGLDEGLDGEGLLDPGTSDDGDAFSRMLAEMSPEESAERGPTWAALTSELAAARADREAAAAKTLAFEAAQESAVDADDLPTRILGVSLQEQFAAEMAFLDDSGYEAKKKAVYAQGAKDTSEGGRGWGESGPRDALDAKEQAILNRFLGERITDPQEVLARLQKERAEAVVAELRRNPAKAELNGLEWSPFVESFVPVGAPTVDASRLDAGEFAALTAFAKGERVSPPAGHTAESWRRLTAAWVQGDRE